MEHVDLVLYDLKHMDAAIHRKFTGVSNRWILKNLSSLMSETKAEVWIRIPVTPAFNNTIQEIDAIGAFIHALPRPIDKVSVFPFHQYGAGKYLALGRPYRWSDQSVVPERKIGTLVHRLKTYDLNVEFGR